MQRLRPRVGRPLTVAKVLFCPACAEPAMITVEHPTKCAACGGPVLWIEVEVPVEPVTFTVNDRRLLKSMRISAE